MKILAIETATLLGGIALLDDSAGLIAEIRLNVKSTHSERLMTGVDTILRQSSLTMSDVDVFAVSIGPGSFTGLRIGLSTVKGLSYATGNPVVTVPTLEALALNFSYCKYPVCTMLDARKNEVYAALFQWNGNGFTRLLHESALSVSELAKTIIPHIDDKVILTGEGTLLYKEELTRYLGGKAIFAPPDKIAPSPVQIAVLGIQKALNGDFSELNSLVPFYIRRSEAELKKDVRNKTSKNAAI